MHTWTDYQWNTIESPEIDPHTYGNIVNIIEGISNHTEKHNLFSKWCGDNWIAIFKN